MPKMAATPMIMWKWPTTKQVSWKYRSSAGWPRKIPLSPPVTNSDTKPRANIMAVVKRILPPHKVPIQLNVLMADGTPMAMVSTENAIADPVECLNGRRHPDGHGQHRKRHRRIGAHAAHEHVVAPHQEAQKADAQDRVHHGPVSEDCLARESGEQLRSHTHAGQNRDVNLGMAKEPEQMLPEQRRSAFVIQNLVADQQAARHEEAGSGGAVENQQNSGGQPHGESQQGQDSRYKPGPAGQGQAHERHPLAAQVDESGNEVDGAHQRGAAEDGNADNPERLS